MLGGFEDMWQGLALHITRRLVLSVVCGSLILAPAVTAGAREKQEAGVIQVYGYVTKVESKRITIMSLMGDAKLLPLITQEDFTEKVAKGSKVTSSEWRASIPVSYEQASESNAR